MAGTQGWVDSALDELMADRQKCAARIANLDAAILAFQDLRGHEPSALPSLAPAAKKAAHQKPPARKSSAVRQQILDALRHQSLSPANLAETIGMKTGAAMYHVKKLEADGAVVLTGKSNFDRRVALPSGTAKEAP